MKYSQDNLMTALEHPWLTQPADLTLSSSDIHVWRATLNQSVTRVQQLAHLFKTQVYQLADYLGVPEEIRNRTPTTDTYSAECTQEEFFFRLPFELMDLLWYAQEQDVPVSEVARSMGLSEEQVQRAFDDFERKQRATEYVRIAPIKYGNGIARK